MMNTPPVELTKHVADLTIDIRSANGSSTEFYEADEERVREALRLLSAPQLFAQPRLVLASPQGASMLPCRGIDMILVHTVARTPLRFPLHLPVGLFDIVEHSDAWPDNNAVAIEPPDEQKPGQSNRRSLQVEVHTLGGWTVALRADAIIRGQVQDERQFFSHLPEMPTIPFRLVEGGFGLINTANVTRASAKPKPEAIPGMTLPLTLRRWTPSRAESPANLAWAVHS